MPGAGALLRFDHQLEVGRSWAKRPHAAASCPLRLRSFGLRAAFCDFLAAGTGSWARSVVAGPVDAVAAVVTALSGAERGKLAGDAETCGLSGALVACEGDEAIVEGAFPAGEGGETIVESVVLRLRGTVAITD